MNADIGDKHIKHLEEETGKLVSKFKEDVRAIRGNRPTTELIENLKADYYNQTLTVKELGSISVVPPREISVSVWDKNAVSPVIKAIEAANIGLSIQNDGNVIRAFLPALTEERREEFTKLAKKGAEAARIQLRSRRDEAIKRIKASADAKEMSEDAAFKTKERVQKIIDGANAEIEKAVEAKMQELR